MLILTYKSIGKFMVQFVGSDEHEDYVERMIRTLRIHSSNNNNTNEKGTATQVPSDILSNHHFLRASKKKMDKQLQKKYM